MNSSDIVISNIDNVAVLEIQGNVLQENVDAFRNKLYYLLENDKTMIILNLAKANYISSLCLAVIIDVKLRLKKLGGDLKLASPNRLVRNLMELTNLIKQFTLYDTVELAVEAFEEEQAECK